MRISEILPNPRGADGANEWIELYNDSEAAVSLSGWTVRIGKRHFSLHDTLAPGEFVVVQGKLSIRNREALVTLHQPNGTLVDTLQVRGSGGDDTSFTPEIGWTTPTPGIRNATSAAAIYSGNVYGSDATFGNVPHGMHSQNLALNAVGFGLLVGVGLALLLAKLYAVPLHIYKRDSGNRGISGWDAPRQ